MNDDRVLIKFKCGEYEVEGLSPIYSTLSNALRAIGARQFIRCDDDTDHRCHVEIKQGRELIETIGFLDTGTIEKEEVAACNIRLVAAGALEVEMIVDTATNVELDPNDEIVQRIVKDFESLPLDKKIAALAGLELNALGETAAYVISSPYELFGKVRDILAEVGIKKDEADHKRRSGDVNIDPLVSDTMNEQSDHLN